VGVTGLSDKTELTMEVPLPQSVLVLVSHCPPSVVSPDLAIPVINHPSWWKKIFPNDHWSVRIF